MELITRLAAIIDRNEVMIPKTEFQTGANSKITSIVELVFGVFGGVALIIIILAGIQFITSQGDPQKTAKARNTIIYAAVGLAVSLTAFAIVSVVVNRV